MTNSIIDIYHYPSSPPSRATLLVVKALDIKHNVKIVDLLEGEQMKPEFIRMNPTHTVPTMDDSNFILWDSHVIMKYLVDQYGKDDSLFPKDPKQNALVNQKLYFEATSLFPAFVRYVRPVIFKGEQPDPHLAAQFEEELALLNKFLQNSKWVAGDSMTVADFSVIAVISTAEAINMKISKYPNILTWYAIAKEAMEPFGYEEVNQIGANNFGAAFQSKLIRTLSD